MSEVRRALGAPIKAIDGNRVSGYLVRFTSKDDPDLHGEYFTKDTNFWLKELSPIGKPIFLDHTFDGKFKSIPVGIIDFLKEDEVGLWIEGKLKERAEYEDMLRGWKNRKWLSDDMIKDSEIPILAQNLEMAVKGFFGTGKAQWSSGALPQVVETAEDGHIESWPIIEGTGVFTPAEPDGTEIKLKSALEQMSHILKSIPAPAREATEPIEREADTNQRSTQDPKPQNKGTKAMTPEMLKELIAILQGMLNEQGVPDGESQAMASEVVEEMKADEELKPEEGKAVDEELVKAWMGKAIAKAQVRMQKRANALSAAKSMASQASDAWKANAPVSESAFLPKYTGGQKGIESVREFTPYTNWKAEDYSFAIGLAEMSKSTGKKLDFRPDQRFYREFADKAEKRLRDGSIKMDSAAIKGIYAIKSDELDYSTQAGYGDEWVPTVWADNIWERPRLENVVQNLFGSVEMPSNPYEYPVEAADPTVYLVGETKNENVLALDISTSPIPDSKVATAKVTFTAAKLGLRVVYSAELGEDGIARLVPQFRGQSERTMLDAIDYVALNGDTATTLNVNSDGETITDTTRRYLAYNGLIKQALVTASTNKLDANQATPSLSLLRGARALLGNAEGYNPENLAWIMDYPTYIKLLNDDVVISVDKYGPQATVIAGELGRIDGIRVFVSAQMALADADGKITQTANVVNRGRAVLVHVPSWLFGYRRRISQSLDFLPWADAWSLVITMRNHFVPRTASNGTLQSTDDSTAIVYNMTV